MIKNKYSLLSFCILLIIFSFTRLKLFFSIFPEFNHFLSSSYQDELFWFIDYYISLILFLLLVPFLIIKWKSKIMNIKLKYSGLILLYIILFITFFPLLAGHYQPIDRNRISAARLAPFSSLNYLMQKKKQNYIIDLKSAYSNQNRIYYDSVNSLSNPDYFLKGELVNFNRDEVEFELGKPKIFKEFFLFGTDEYGRDLFTQIIFGLRKSILISLCAMIFSVLVGLFLGYVSAMNDNIWGHLINEFALSLFSIPSILIFIVAAVAVGNSFLSLILIMGSLGWITIFKITRNEVKLIKQKNFFITSKHLGLTNWQLIFHEIFTYISGQLLLSIIFLFINFIFAEASLSFIGLSNDETYISLGTLIQRGNFYINNSYWLILFPSLALACIILFLNYLKNHLRGIIDPRVK